MGRSNLRAKAAYGGYNLVDVRQDSMLFRERLPGIETRPAWTGIRLEPRKYDTIKSFPRPSFKLNDSFPEIRPKWIFSSDANVISTPAVADGMVIFGNSLGMVVALDISNGREKWSFHSGSAIYSSPAVSNGLVVMGSGDGNIYCLSTKNGHLRWKYKTQAAVLGSPTIHNGVVFIGGSDHNFRAIELKSGKQIWAFSDLEGPVVSTPVIYENKVIFGAWDRNLYALSGNEGKLIWKWNNGSKIRNLSPASCIPVIKDDVVYIVAPDRYLTAIDINSGLTLWRTNESTVRESIGISTDGRFIYGKTMMDTVVAFPTSREKQVSAWKLNAGFGYEHVPSMLREMDGNIYFGTKNGVVYAVRATSREVAWKYKLDNSMVNTVNVLGRDRLVVSTMDGKVALLENRN
jgi:outer membrane protein assembly factor BamB